MECFAIWYWYRSTDFSFIINKAIGKYSDFAANYLDDIIVYSRTVEDHLKHLEHIFAALQKADLKIKAS